MYKFLFNGRCTKSTGFTVDYPFNTTSNLSEEGHAQLVISTDEKSNYTILANSSLLGQTAADSATVEWKPSMSELEVI